MAIPWNVRKYATVNVLYEQDGEECQRNMTIDDAISFVQDPTVMLISAKTPKQGVDYTSDILEYARNGFTNIKSYFGIGEQKSSTVVEEPAVKPEVVEPAETVKPKPEEEPEWDLFSYEKQLDEEEEEQRRYEEEIRLQGLEDEDRAYFEDLERRGLPKGVELSYDDEVYYYEDPYSGQEKVCFNEKDIPDSVEYKKCTIGELPCYLSLGLIKPSKRR